MHCANKIDLFKKGIRIWYALFFYSVTLNAQYIRNPSFENDTTNYFLKNYGLSIVPPMWDSCSGSPDNFIQPHDPLGFPSYKCYTDTAVRGITGLNTIENSAAGFATERVSNQLLQPLLKNKPYFISFWIEDNASCTQFLSQKFRRVGIRMYAGNSKCSFNGSVLLQVDSLAQDHWQQVCTIIVPDSNYNYIAMEPFSPYSSGQKGVLWDEMYLNDYMHLKIKGNKNSCIGSSDTLRINAICAMQYSWIGSNIIPDKLNDSTFVVVYNTLGNYDFKLKATSPGFSDSTAFKVEVKDCFHQPPFAEIKISNLITANGDGKNDYFEIANSLSDIHVEIYNRWGKNIFENSNYKNDWQGEDGLYYYFLKVDEKTYKGWLQVVR
jgi:gliding motility-associated-like protein